MRVEGKRVTGEAGVTATTGRMWNQENVGLRKPVGLSGGVTRAVRRRYGTHDKAWREGRRDEGWPAGNPIRLGRSLKLGRRVQRRSAARSQRLLVRCPPGEIG